MKNLTTSWWCCRQPRPRDQCSASLRCHSARRSQHMTSSVPIWIFVFFFCSSSLERRHFRLANYLYIFKSSCTTYVTRLSSSSIGVSIVVKMTFTSRSSSSIYRTLHIFLFILFVLIFSIHRLAVSVPIWSYAKRFFTTHAKRVSISILCIFWCFSSLLLPLVSVCSGYFFRGLLWHTFSMLPCEQREIEEEEVVGGSGCNEYCNRITRISCVVWRCSE